MAERRAQSVANRNNLRVIRAEEAFSSSSTSRRTRERSGRAQNLAVSSEKRQAKKQNAFITKVKEIDFVTFAIVLALVCFGLVMVFSSSYYYADKKFGDGTYYFKKQVIGAIIGLVAMGVLANFDYHKLEKLKWPAIIIAVGLLAAVLIPGIGQNKNEASRWLDIAGVSVQPSEIAKFAVILFMSATMSKNQKYMKKFTVGVLPNLILLGLVCGLIILQPNLSTVISICLLGFVMMYAGGCRMRQLIPLAVMAVVAMVALMIIAPYRMQRYQVFLDPWADPLGDGYQLIQSLYAIGGGGLFGTGLGFSRQKLLFLPYGESDFIFSVIAEELGFVGVVALIALFVLLVWRGIKIALTARDQFGALLATGVVSIIAIQAIIHIGVATGSMPPTGVSLPFISAGLSSLIIFMASIGVLLNVSRYSKQ